MKKSAAAFNASGTSLDKSLALIVATNDVLQNPETTGTLWNTLSARIRGASLELETLGEETDEYVTSTSKLRDLVKGTTGFDILKEDGQTFKDLYDIMLGIGEVWDDLTDTTKAGLAEALAGKRNARGLYSIFSNMEDLQDAYATAESAAGSASREQENYAQSVQYSIDRAKASLEQLANDFLSSDLLKGLIEAGNSALKVIDNIVAKLGSVQSIILALSGMSLIKNLIGAESIVGNLIGSITESVTGKEASKSLIPNLKKLFGGIAAKRAAKEAGKSFSEGLAEGTAGTVADTMVDGSLSGAADAAAKAGTSAGISFSTAFIAAIAGAAVVGGIAYAIYSVEQAAIEKARQKTEQDVRELENTSKTLDDYKEKYRSLYEKMNDPNNTDAETLEYKRQIYELQKDIVSLYGDQANGIDLVNGKLETQEGVIDQIYEKLSGAELLSNEATYNRAEEAMNSIGSFNLGSYNPNNKYGKKVQESIDKLREKYDINTYDMDSDGTLDIELNVDYLHAEEAINEFSEDVLSIFGSANSDVAKSLLAGFDNSINNSLAKASSVTDKHRDLYMRKLEASLNKSNDNILKRYREAVDNLNEAYVMGDEEAIKTAEEAFAPLEKEKEKVLSKNAKYGILFDDAQVDQAKRDVHEIQNLITDLSDVEEKHAEQSSNKDTGIANRFKRELDEAKQYLEEETKDFKNLLSGTSFTGDETVFGNIDLNNRGVIKWTNQLINQYSEALKSWGEEAPEELIGEISTVFGAWDDIPFQLDGVTIPIAFSPMLQTGNGNAELLDADTVTSYIQELLRKIESDDSLSIEDLFNLDAAGLDIGGKHISGLIAGYGDEADEISELMHFLGTDGSINTAQKEYNDALANYEEQQDKHLASIKEKDQEYRNSLKDTFKGTKFEKNADEIIDSFDAIKAAAIDDVDMRQAIAETLKYDNYKDLIAKSGNSVFQEIGEELSEPHPEYNAFIRALADSYGLAGKSGSEFDSIVDSIINHLSEIPGFITLQADESKKWGVDLTDLKSSASSAMSAIDSLNAALASSASGKGMSYEWDAENGAYTGDVANIQKMFEGMEGYNPATLFRRTANGIKVNTNELRKLQKAQEDITKDKFYEKQTELSERLAEAEKLRAINDPSAPSDEVVNRLRDQLEEVNLLASAYDGATSAYQQWLNAQSAGEEGDVYDNIRDTALKRGDELLEKGLIGTEEFRAVTELMTGLDLTSASAVEVAEAYKTIDNEIGDTGHTMRDFFKEGFDGASEYLDVLEKLGYAWTDEQGNTWFNDINTAELAEQLGTSVDVVESLFGKLHDYGAEFHIFTPEQAAELNAQKESIEEVKTAIDEANKDAEHPIQIRTDVENMNDLDTLNGEIDHIQGILKHPTEVGINDTQYQAFAQLLDELIKRKEILQGFDTSEGVTTNAIDAGATALQTLNESMEKYSELGLEINLDDKTLVDAAEVIESLPEELKIKFGFEGDATAEEILEQLAGEHSVTVAVKPDGMPTSAWEAKQKAEQESASEPIKSAGDEFKEAISTVADDVSTKVNEAGKTFAQTVTEAATTFKEILNGGTDAEKRQNEYERKTQDGYKEAEATKKQQEEIRKQREAEAAAEAERLKALKQQEYENLTESKRNEPTAQRRENRDAIAENQNRWIRQTVAGQRELDTVARNKEIEQARQQELEDLQRYNRDYENIKRHEMDVLKQETDRKQEEDANKPSIIDKIPGNKLSDEEIERRLSQEQPVYDSSFGPSPEEFKDYDVSLGGIADAAAAAGAALTGVTVEASELDSGIQKVQETASQPIDVGVNVDSTEVESAVSSAQESAPPVEVSADLSTEQIDAEIASLVETEKPVIKPLIQMPDTPVSGALTTIKQSIQTTVDTSNVDAATTNIANKDVAISVDTTEAQANIDTLKQSIEEVTTPQEGSASVKVEGTSDLESLNSAEQTFHAFGDHTNRNAAITEGLQALQDMNSANTTFRGFQDKTVTNTTKNITENIVRGATKLNGTANVNGTALSNFYGSAYAGGKWGTKKDETALVGELGREIMVSPDGHWETIGDTGAEFKRIPAGSIIFNHEQTEDLLKDGKTHGRAHVGGTAYGLTTRRNDRATVVTGGLSASARPNTSGTESAIRENTQAIKDSTKQSKDSGKSNEKSKNTKAKKDRTLVDWIEVLIDKLQKELEHFKALGEYFTEYLDQNKELDNAISTAKELIDNQQKANKRYMKQVSSGLVNYTYQDDKGNSKRLFTSKDGSKSGKYSYKTYQKYLKLIKNGNIDIESIKDANLASAISEAQGFKNKADEAKAAVLEMKQEIIELNKQKLDNIIDDFDKIVNLNQSNADISESIIKLYDKLGMSRDDIVKQYQNEGSFINKNIIEREKELIAYRDEITKQLNGNLKDPERRREAETELNKINKELLDTRVRIYEINEAIRELNWKNFNIGTEILSHMESQLNSTLDLLSDFTTFNKNSSALTDMGLTQVNLNAQLMGEARKQIKHYQEAIKAVTAELKDKRITEEQANKDIREYQENILSAANSLKKYKNAIISYIKDGINKETEAMSELISKRKEALQRQKDADDYAKSIRDKTKNINKLQLQIASMSGDTTDATRAKVKQLNAQLKEAQEDLDETRKQHSYDTLVEGLDDENEAFKKRQDERVATLEASLSEQDKAIESLLFSTAQKFDTTATQLKSIMDSFGITLESDIVKPWNNAEEAMTTFATAVTPLDNVKGKIAEVREELEKQATINVNKEQIDALDLKIDEIKQKIAALNGEAAEGQEGTSVNIPVNSDKIKSLQAELDALEAQKAVLNGDTKDGKPGKKIDIPINFDNVETLLTKLKEAQEKIDKINKNGFVDEEGSGNDGSGVPGRGAGGGSSSGGNSGGNTGGSTIKSNITPITTVKTESFSSNGNKQATVLVPINKTYTNGKNATVYVPSTSAGGGIQSVTSTEKGISVTRKGTGGKVTSVAKNKKLKTQKTDTYKFRKEPKKEAAYATGDGITKGTIPNNKDVTTTGKVSYQGNNLWLQVKYNKTTGWIRYDGLKKAQVGTKAARRGLYLTDEEGLGSEAILTKKGVLRQLDAGDTVFNAKQRETLWNMSKMDLSKMPGLAGGNNVTTVTNNYGSLLTVNGNVDKEALPKLQEILKQACEYTKKDIFMNQKKMGFR